MANDLSSFKRQIPSIDLNDYRFTFYGQPGSGKSSTAFYFFNDPIFFAWEKGQKTLPAFIWECYTWKDMLDFIKQAKRLAKAGEDQDIKDKVIIMDTAEIMRDASEIYVCEMNGWDSPSDGEWGSGFAECRREFERKVEELESMGFKVNFIAHDKIQNVERKDGEKYDKTTLMLGSSAINAVIKKVDIVMYFDFEYEKDKDGNTIKRRVIRFGGGDKYEAKCRIPGFPELVYSGDSPEETAKILRDLFTEKLTEMTDEQLAKLKEINQKEVKPIPEKVETPKEDVVTKQEINELSDKAMELCKTKVCEASDIADLVKKHTTVDKISELRDRKEFEQLKSAIENI